MLKTVTLITAVLAAMFVCLSGLPAVPVLSAAWRRRSQRDDPTKKSDRAPGGLLLAVGTLAAFWVGFLLADSQLAPNGYTGGFRTALTLFGAAALFGLVGLSVDGLRYVRHGRRPARWARLLLQLFAAAFLTAQMAVNGELTTALRLPGVGTVQLGRWFYPLVVLLLLALVTAADLCSDVDGITVSTGFTTALTLLIVAILLLEPDIPGDHFVAALFTAALAGGCVGFLFWNYYPARVAAGASGSYFLAGGFGAAVLYFGRPELLLTATLVWWAPAAAALIRCLTKSGKGRGPRENAPWHVLPEKGWGLPTLTALGCVIGAVGGLLTVLLLLMGRL